MDVRSDFAETGKKFADDNQFVKARYPKPARDHPDKENRERRQPRPPPTPSVVEAGPSRTGILPAASYFKHHNSREQERVENRSFDQHSRAEQTKHDPAVACVPRLTLSNFFPNQKADQENDESERHV